MSCTLCSTEASVSGVACYNYCDKQLQCCLLPLVTAEMACIALDTASGQNECTCNDTM